MIEFKYWAKTLYSPSCWLRNYKTDFHWDKKIREMLGNPVFTELKAHQVKLNGVDIWISNHPYASMVKPFTIGLGMPRRSTVFKLYDLLQKSEVEAMDND